MDPPIPDLSWSLRGMLVVVVVVPTDNKIDRWLPQLPRRPLPVFLFLFRCRPPLQARRCIAGLRLPLPLLMCRTRLGQVVRFG